MRSYTLKYRTFTQLLDEVSLDFTNYSLENLIFPEQLIKVARRCTYDLGLRVYKTKEALLEVEKGRVRLPEDFYVFNFGMLCGSYTVKQTLPQGTHIEERMITPTYLSIPTTVNTCTDPVICSGCNSTPCGCDPTSSSIFACNQPQTCTSSSNTSPCDCPTCVGTPYNPLVPFGDSCVKPRVFTNCKNECIELIQIVNTETRTYSQLMPLRIISNAEGIECGCPGLYKNSAGDCWIKDGFLFTSFNCGKVYLNYEAMLQTEDGELMVVDHEMINEFYEYALKQKILENLFMNDENVQGKLQMIEQKLRIARANAMNIVNMPNFSEIQGMWKANRRAQYQKYYYQFANMPWFNSASITSHRNHQR